MANEWLTWAFRALLLALGAYMATLTTSFHRLEKDYGVLSERYQGFVDTRTFLVGVQAKDREQLNTRVKTLEDARVVQADMLARLRSIEDLLRARKTD